MNATAGYIYSTLATDIRIVEWLPTENETPIEGRSVLIKGGAGISNKHLLTPLGVVTPLDAEQIALISKHPVFLKHEKIGHLRIEKRKEDIEKVVADMNRNDPSAPMTRGDLPPEIVPNI